MASYNGQNFTSFSGVNSKGTIALRVSVGASGMESTLSARSDDEGVRAWQFPAKSGAFAISGTFTVNLASISAATQLYTTVSTVSGIRAEDGLTVSMQSTFDNTARILLSATPGNGQITTNWYNLGVASNAKDYVIAYTAVR